MRRPYRDNDIYGEDDYEDLGIPPQEDLYADYYGTEDEDEPEEALPPVPEDRESYYARRDAYYARRDAYYAERDAYYARMEDEGEDWDQEPGYRASRPRDYDLYDDRGPRRRDRGRSRRRRRRKKGWLFRRILIVLMAAVLVLLLTGKAPVRNPRGLAREAGHSTILLAGTDESGNRTDTVMLLSLDRGAGQLRLLSIPRDTYTPEYAAFKINSAYGSRGGGAAGM